MPCANAMGSLPQNATKHQAPHLIRYGAYASRVLHGRTHRDSAIISGSLWLRSAHNSDKWHFNAWFGLFYSELIPNFIPNWTHKKRIRLCGSNTFHLPFFLAPSRCKTPFFFNSAMYFSIWRADIPHCSANCLAEMEASARIN